MKITSRKNYAHEKWQMESFAKLLVEYELLRWVREVYFDSNASICFVYLDQLVAEESWISNRVIELATQTITQFEMFGIIHNGIESE